jgi:glycosyltransferase
VPLLGCNSSAGLSNTNQILIDLFDDGAPGEVYSAMRNPKISLITASYNNINTIKDCLRSVSDQSWSNVEHIIIDGASVDGTVEYLREHKSQISVLISEQDQGIYYALNKGLANCSGDIVGFLHADDVFANSDILEKVGSAFQDVSIGAVYGDLQYVRRRDITSVVRHWKAGEFTPQRLKWGWMPPHPSLYVRRQWYDKIGGFDTSYRIAADYASVVALFSHQSLNPRYLPEVFVKMRLGGLSNRSVENLFQKSREDFALLRESDTGGFGALACKNLGKLKQFLHRV